MVFVCVKCEGMVMVDGNITNIKMQNLAEK